MVNYEMVRKLLETFASLFTQPLEQEDLPTAIKSAASALTLCTLPGLGLLVRGVRFDFFKISLMIMLICIGGTSIVSRSGNKVVQAAKNLTITTFWIAMTLLVVLGVIVIFPDPLDSGIRRLIASVLLVVLIPVHLFQSSVRVMSASWLTLFLWLTITMLFLTWRIV